MARSTFERLRPGRPIKPLRDSVSLWDGSQLRILGYVMVLVSWNGTSRQLPIHVIEGGGPSLLGRDWLSALNIRITGLQPPTNVQAFRRCHLTMLTFLSRHLTRRPLRLATFVRRRLKRLVTHTHLRSSSWLASLSVSARV